MIAVLLSITRITVLDCFFICFFLLIVFGPFQVYFDPWFLLHVLLDNSIRWHFDLLFLPPSLLPNDSCSSISSSLCCGSFSVSSHFFLRSSLSFLLHRCGVQAPTMLDIGMTLVTSSGGFPLVLSGNPEIDTSVVDGFELAYDRNLTSTTTLRTALFQHKTTDVKGVFGLFPDRLPPSAPVPTLLFDNRGDTEVAGFEIGLDGNPEGSWSWGANYTYQHAADELIGTFGLQHVQDWESTTPEHLFNARVGWTGERFATDVFVNYVSATESPYQPTFPGLARIEIDDAFAASFRSSYDVNDHVRIAVTGQNVTFGDGELTNPNTLTENRIWASLSVRR